MEHEPGDACTWPFHHPECEECKKWDEMYGENLDNYLRVKAEIQEAARQAQRAARAAKRKTTPTTPPA